MCKPGGASLIFSFFSPLKILAVLDELIKSDDKSAIKQHTAKAPATQAQPPHSRQQWTCACTAWAESAQLLQWELAAVLPLQLRLLLRYKVTKAATTVPPSRWKHSGRVRHKQPQPDRHRRFAPRPHQTLAHHKVQLPVVNSGMWSNVSCPVSMLSWVRWLTQVMCRRAAVSIFGVSLWVFFFKHDLELKVSPGKEDKCHPHIVRSGHSLCHQSFATALNKWQWTGGELFCIVTFSVVVKKWRQSLWVVWSCNTEQVFSKSEVCSFTVVVLNIIGISNSCWHTAAAVLAT